MPFGHTECGVKKAMRFNKSLVSVRDMTPEEIAEMEKIHEEMPEPEPTPEERISTLEVTTDDIVLMLADIIGGEE